MELNSKIWITHKGEMVFGRGRAQLHEAVERTGSLSEAARRLGLSYRHAWSMLDSSERHLGKALVKRTRGGAGGGGAALTAAGRNLLGKYLAIEQRFEEFARDQSHEL